MAGLPAVDADGRAGVPAAPLVAAARRAGRAARPAGRPAPIGSSPRSASASSTPTSRRRRRPLDPAVVELQPPDQGRPSTRPAASTPAASVAVAVTRSSVTPTLEPRPRRRRAGHLRLVRAVPAPLPDVPGDAARRRCRRGAASRRCARSSWDGMPADDAFVHSIETCVQCRGCETACPSGVPFGHLMEATRETLAARARRRSSRDGSGSRCGRSATTGCCWPARRRWRWPSGPRLVPRPPPAGSACPTRLPVRPAAAAAARATTSGCSPAA